MTATNFNEFKKLFNRIPKDRLPFVHFIPLRTGTKVPIGNWKGKAHLNLYEVKNAMGFGGNIAVAGISKGLMFLDIDTDYSGNIKMPLFLLDSIPNTFRVKTRSGGLHFYFLNNGEWDNQKFIYQGLEIGELRTNWQYVVSAGSWVEPETYRVVNDVPILDFTGEITNLFRKGNVKNLNPNQLPPTPDKKGKPISSKHQGLLDMMNKEKEGKIESTITNSERKKELLYKLHSRGYNVL